MDTDAMYERGVADAEQGEPHPFYYQHYYHYKRGYDHARRRMRQPWGGEQPPRRVLIVLIAMAVVAVIGVGVYFFTRKAPEQTQVAAPTLLATAVLPTALPVRTPIFPTATPPPTVIPSPTLANLRIGAKALVTTTDGKVLRGRQKPGLNAPNVVSFKPGEQVEIVEGPVEADGYVWWRVQNQAGTGWSAQQSQEGEIWLQPVGQ